MRRSDFPSRALLCAALWSAAAVAGQPPEPVEITPIDGAVYYVLNQATGLEAGPPSSGNQIVQQPPSFTDLGRRWAFTSVAGGFWRISNAANGLCLDSLTVAGAIGPLPPRKRRGEGRFSGTVEVVENPCAAVDRQRWILTPTTNGYYTIANKSTRLLIDGTPLAETQVARAVTQSQQWLLRPAFFRGIDNALLEKQEAARVAAGLAWWNDAGQQQDVLEMFKDHGVNMVRVRPTSVPPYANASAPGCTGNACYAETDAQDLDLARRARNLGMSVELTLLFDGGSSSSVPAAWAKDVDIPELQADLYAYVKSEILSYREAGAMPDLVSIGNEVDTGFLGPLASPTGSNFGNFAALQIAAIQAVHDAAADTSAGPALPPPLVCIHITPAWDLTQFFTLANQFNIPYDAICQSYYPIYHGPLTDTQAAAFNPNHQPVEQTVLTNSATNIGKPIFIIETGEHYENGFGSDDPWYAPPAPASQRQFLLDLESVERSLPDNLGMGIEYWDPAGVNIPGAADAAYAWTGLTLFDEAGPTLLPGADALGGKLDSTLSYRLVNRSNGGVLSVSGASQSSGAALDAETDAGNPSLSHQWRITSDDDGYFEIASLNPGAGGTTNVMAAGGSAVIQSPSGSGQDLEWDVVSAGGGYFRFVNRMSAMALDLGGATGTQAVLEAQDRSSPTQEWRVVPVH
jgi:arabinogalactan endo-1,4-beta-galactosidase